MYSRYCIFDMISINLYIYILKANRILGRNVMNQKVNFLSDTADCNYRLLIHKYMTFIFLRFKRLSFHFQLKFFQLRLLLCRFFVEMFRGIPDFYCLHLHLCAPFSASGGSFHCLLSREESEFYIFALMSLSQ